jgi:CheY-like chemotaxis protein
MNMMANETDGGILLVEDWIGHARLIRMALTEAGIGLPVVHAVDGRSAAGILFPERGEAAVHLRPSVVLLDMSLPDMEGGELLARIRAHPRTGTLPVVGLSAADSPEDRQCCERLGGQGFLLKPPEAGEMRGLFVALGLLDGGG